MEAEQIITDEEFDRITDIVKTREDDIKKLGKDEKLAIYAHGKQGRFGDNNDPKPGMLDIKEKFKWEAWTDIKGMDKQVARQKFMEFAKAYY